LLRERDGAGREDGRGKGRKKKEERRDCITRPLLDSNFEVASSWRSFRAGGVRDGQKGRAGGGEKPSTFLIFTPAAAVGVYPVWFRGQQSMGDRVD